MPSGGPASRHAPAAATCCAALLGALLAQGLDAKTALRLAVCLHGAAADALRGAQGAARSASTASELPDAARALAQRRRRATAAQEPTLAGLRDQDRRAGRRARFERAVRASAASFSGNRLPRPRLDLAREHERRRARRPSRSGPRRVAAYVNSVGRVAYSEPFLREQHDIERRDRPRRACR